MATVIDDLLVRLGFDADTSGADRFDGSLNNVLGTVGKLGAAVVGAGALIGGFLGKSLVDTASQFEQFETQLTTIEGSSEKAKESLDWISEFGARTPYDVAQVTDAFVKLKSYGLDPINGGLLESIGNTAAAMGKSLTQGVEAVADAVRGENERLKEFGIVGSKDKSTGEITYTYDYNGQAFEKTVDNDSKQIQGALQEIFDEKFRGGMEAMSKTWAGTLSNMGDTWTMMQLKIMNNGLFDRMKDGLNDIMLWVFDNRDAIDAWANAIGENLVVAWDWLIDAAFDAWDAISWVNDALYDLLEVTGLAAHGGKILAGFIALIAANLAGLAALKVISTIMMMARGFALLLSPLALIGGALIAFFLVAQDIYGYINGKDSVIGGLIKDYPQLQYVVDAVIRLVDALKRLWTDNQAGIMQLFDAIVGLYNAFEPVLNMVIAILPYAFEALLMAITIIIDSISLVIQGLVLVVTGVVMAITAIWSGLWNSVRSVAVSAIDIVSNRIESIISMIGTAISKVKELADFNPVALGGKAADWFKGKFSGGSSSDNRVSQTINVNSASEASMIAQNSIPNAVRKSNNGYN